MPDITMCQNTDCKKKNECYRFMAIPSSMQYYASFIEVPCKYFMHIEGRKKRNEKGPETIPEPEPKRYEDNMQCHIDSTRN